MTSLIPRLKVASEGEKYNVLEKIGHGSFGVIQKVQRKSDGLILCRKEISYARMTQKEREQLSAELSILQNLKHKNIVAYYEKEHLKSSQDLHLYMEYCGNGDLGRYIKNLKLKNEYADEQFVWMVLAQLVTALYRCHYGQDVLPIPPNCTIEVEDVRAPSSAASSVMILHRDLKPENIFLSENHGVRLGDFGLSKILQSHGFAQTYVGTPFYMCPEICNGEKYTLFSDIWSLGCIVYELCAREPPFVSNTHLGLFNKIKSGKYARIPSRYSDSLQAIIERCLVVNPNNRADTVELLNHERVKMARKEQALADYMAELEKKTAQLEVKIKSIQEETEARVRRECDMVCHAEHGQWVEKAKQEALRALQNQFEVEVQRRVAQEVEVQVAHIRQEFEHRYSNTSNGIGSGDRSNNSSNSSSVNSSSQPFFSASSSQSSLEMRIDSQPAEIPTLLPKIPKARATRTPFSRAHTCAVVPSPMDISIVDPSPLPAPISHLGLSPRRAVSIPNLGSASSLAANPNGLGTKRVIPGSSLVPSPTLSMDDDVDFEECIDSLDTPSRVRPSVRPVSSQPSIRSNLPKFRLPPSFAEATNKPSGSIKPTVLPIPSSIPFRRPASAVSAPGPSSPIKTLSNKPGFEPRRPAPGAPALRENRFGENVPTVAPSLAPTSGAGTGLGLKSKRGNEALLKTVTHGNHNAAIHGRTLVELAHGMTNIGGGIRSVSADLDPRKKAAVYGEPAMWDLNSEMTPSPFVVRSRRADDIAL